MHTMLQFAMKNTGFAPSFASCCWDKFFMKIFRPDWFETRFLCFMSQFWAVIINNKSQLLSLLTTTTQHGKANNHWVELTSLLFNIPEVVSDNICFLHISGQIECCIKLIWALEVSIFIYLTDAGNTISANPRPNKCYFYQSHFL